MERIYSPCEIGPMEEISSIVNSTEESLMDREEEQKLVGLLGRLWNCFEEMPRQVRDKLLDYVETFYGHYQGDHEITTYAQVARFVRPLIKDVS